MERTNSPRVNGTMHLGQRSIFHRQRTVVFVNSERATRQVGVKLLEDALVEF